MNQLPTVSLAAEVTSKDLTRAQEGGWTYPAIAQKYKDVNDWLLYFFPNSGAKTIQERVPRRAIKIEDGHPMDGSVSSVFGYVASAEERQSGMRYVGFVSKQHEEIADKITDGTISENSIVLNILERAPKFVAIDLVPEISREFVTLNKDGLAVVTGIKQYRWKSVGLVSSSSQDFNAILAPPTMVGAAGALDVKSGPWDPAIALQAVRNWGGTNPARISRAHLVQLYDATGKEIFAGQIAEPGDNGELIVNIGAIPNALADVARAVGESSLAESAKATTIKAAYEQAAACVQRLGNLTVTPASGNSIDGADEATEEPDGITATATSDLESKPAADSQKSAGQATVGSREAANEAALLAHQQRQARIAYMLRTYRGVAHEPTGTSGGTATAGGPGPS